MEEKNKLIRRLLGFDVLFQMQQLHKHSVLSSESILTSSKCTVSCRNDSGEGFEICDLACP